MKRKGFTLIELMVVIAIIIILAAIAIPNYLKMTERAKRSRVASEFNTLATALESFNTDWGNYPKLTTAQAISKSQTPDVVYAELTGVAGAEAAVQNTGSATTSTGEAGPLTYVAGGSLDQMTDPFDTVAGNGTHWYYYVSDTDGLKWVLYAKGPGTEYLFRTSTNGSLQSLSNATPTISDAH